jgi:hypothetical protein
LSALTGAPLPKHKIDGVSILSLLEGDKSANPRNVFYYYYSKRLIAVRKDKWKLVFPHTGRSYKDMKPGKDGYPGPTRTFTVKEPELYNLETDISETTDLSSQYQKVVEELKGIGDSARNDLGDRIRNIKGKGVRKPGRIKQEKTKVNNLAIGKKITINGNAGIEYSAQGDKTLIDGILGSWDFTDGEWLGFQGQDIEINIDFGKTISLKQIDCRFLENQRAWIFSPESFEVSLSKNVIDFKSAKVYEINAEKQQEKETIKEFKVMLNSQKARFIKISVKSIGELPKWHPGAGGKAWVFVDEIVVK